MTKSFVDNAEGGRVPRGSTSRVIPYNLVGNVDMKVPTSVIGGEKR